MAYGYQPDLTATSGRLEIYTEAGERLCTAESVADLAGCKVATLDAKVSWGQMPAPLGTAGSTRLWSRAVVDAWLAPHAREKVPAVLDDEVPAVLDDPVPAVLDDEVPAVLNDEVPAVSDDPVPAELRALRRWTRHDHKRPIMTNGEPAWAMDPPTWTSHAQAKASIAGEGLGFVLAGDGVVALDLSRCVNDGVLTPGARAILDLLPDTYAEVSLSGRGVHLFCHADVAEGCRFSSHGVTIQIFGTGRFLTVTGNRLPGRPSVLAEHDAAVQSLLLGGA